MPPAGRYFLGLNRIIANTIAEIAKTANKWTNRSLPTTTQFCSLLLLYHML
jgi:hypothetical protein